MSHSEKSVVGHKLKILREYRAMTQIELAGGAITRNMLSQIERGASLPSYATIVYLSNRLNVSPAYFFEDGPDLDAVIEEERFARAKSDFMRRDYRSCLICAEGMHSISDPSFLQILAVCAYMIGKNEFNGSSFSSAASYFSISEDYALRSGFDHPYAAQIRFYHMMMNRFSSNTPFHIPSLLSCMTSDSSFSDNVLYMYLNALIDNGQIEDATRIYEVASLQSPFFRSHINARIAASRSNYDRAKELLRGIVHSCEGVPYPFIYNVYNDLERYCKASEDYEGAYDCAVNKQKYGYSV